jgi:NADH:ubiquinone reductase (non-electrogenic)
MQLSSLSRRSLSTRLQSQVVRSARPLRANAFSQQSFQRIARRSYADAAAPTPTPTPKPKKRFRFLRWTWRLTWLSGVGMVGALAYSIYDQRHPLEQFEPDPNKKTLVILGR